MTELKLIFIGNSLKAESLTNLESYLTNTNLESFNFNLYMNSIGAEGAEMLSNSLVKLNEKQQLKYLHVDLYFSNITETGTKSLTNAISQMNSLEELGLNLDFNYIKNEGAKDVGTMFKTMQKLKYINLGVASKNFGYLGFKSLIDGLRTQTELESLVLRCGVNRVGINGA